MKRLFLLTLVVACSLTFSVAQNLPDFASIPLNSAADYNAAANDAALKAASYLLATPMIGDNPSRDASGKYLFNWAQGSPDYSVNIDVALTNLTSGEPKLMMVLIASMCEFMLKNKDKKNDVDVVRLNTVKRLLAYAKDHNNGVKWTGDMAKADDADKHGRLNEYLLKQLKQ